MDGGPAVSAPDVDLKQVLLNTGDDIRNFVTRYLAFFIAPDLEETSSRFEDDCQRITSEIHEMSGMLSESSAGLRRHGLLEPEVGLKLTLYQKIRGDYLKKLSRCLKLYEKLRELTAENFFRMYGARRGLAAHLLGEKVADWPDWFLVTYNKFSTALRRAKRAKERFFSLLDTILKSVADAIGIEPM